MNSHYVLAKANIIILTTIASSAFALAMLAAISALWPHSPNEQGLENFAFSLAATMAMVLGNLSIFAAHLLTKDKPATSLVHKVSGVLSVLVFVAGFITSAVLFTEGLNAWFTVPPTLPASLLTFFRFVLFVPLLWLLTAVIIRILSKKPK